MTIDQKALTRPIVGIENRTAQEVFDIMCDRFRLAALPAPDDGLVERLRSRLVDYDADLRATIAAGILPDRAAYGEDVSGVTYAEISEAATVIQTLQRENARLEDEAEQQVRDMREGLEPFARVGDIFELRAGNRPNSDDDPVTEWEDHRVGARRLTVGDFRRARLLLKESGE